MTFSLIGRCARTGRLGLGITTFSLAVGGRCEGVAANIGVCKTQAFPNRTNDPLGIKLMAEGYVPAKVMAMFAANDSEHDFRQIAIMNRDGLIPGWVRTRDLSATGSVSTSFSARSWHATASNSSSDDSELFVGFCFLLRRSKSMRS